MIAEPAIDWEGRYRDGATTWERPGLNPAFVDWLEFGALKPSRLLVPGAGRSAEPLVLAEAGFDVTVVDLSDTAIAVQRDRLERVHIKARVIQANLMEWEPDAPFDIVYDQTCLCALRPTSWPAYAERVHRWLGGIGQYFVLFMHTGSAGGPPFHCDMTAMRKLFAAPRWAWPATLPPVIEHPSGRTEQPAILRALPA